VSDDDRPKRSWREIDQMRSGGRVDRGEQRPRGKAAEARAAEAARAYLKQADGLFASPQAEGLAKELRDAHGAEGFEEICQRYRAELGLPADPTLLSLFLDSSDAELLAEVLEALLVLARDAGLEVPGGMRTQLRLLSEHRDDNVAGAAEDLLGLA
jgi:hypothetical protein